MGSSYDQAVSALYRAPRGSFVVERRRLAAELKAAGDKVAAAKLAKLERPSISAWAVNQLWWQAREAFEELFETAQQLRAGQLAASPAHRKALARLEARAQQLLSDGGHSANEATLRRIKMTLSSLAAAGDFEPDIPGALTKDREPPGFEALGSASLSDRQIDDEPRDADEAPPFNEGTAARKREAEAAAAEREREREREREAAAAERKREAEAQAERQARRRQLERELHEAKVTLAAREHERARIADQLATAEREVERARAKLDGVQAELDANRAH